VLADELDWHLEVVSLDLHFAVEQLGRLRFAPQGDEYQGD
jgi:hypothetical protein